MPSKTKMRNAAMAGREAALPEAAAELLDQIASIGKPRRASGPVWTGWLKRPDYRRHL